MSNSKASFTFTLLLLLASSCAAASIDVPPESAANPKAHTMPVASEASPLREDYDPWKGSDDESAAHAGHDMGNMANMQH